MPSPNRPKFWDLYSLFLQVYLLVENSCSLSRELWLDFVSRFLVLIAVWETSRKWRWDSKWEDRGDGLRICLPCSTTLREFKIWNSFLYFRFLKDEGHDPLLWADIPRLGQGEEMQQGLGEDIVRWPGANLEQGGNKPPFHLQRKKKTH